jgi:hypothetical protein
MGQPHPPKCQLLIELDILHRLARMTDAARSTVEQRAGRAKMRGHGERSPKEIITEAEDLLRTARFGLEDMEQRPGRAKTGLRNAVVFGRNTTWALQNLKGKAVGFEKWYAAKQEEMKADPLMKYFCDLRTSIEKKASTPTVMSAHIHSFSGNDMAKFGPPPPGATSFFIGDQNGGTGWAVPTPDGGEEKYYVQLPSEIGEVHLHLPEAPEQGEIRNGKAIDLVRIYLNKIGELVSEARKRFAN